MKNSENVINLFILIILLSNILDYLVFNSSSVLMNFFGLLFLSYILLNSKMKIELIIILFLLFIFIFYILLYNGSLQNNTFLKSLFFLINFLIFICIVYNRKFNIVIPCIPVNTYKINIFLFTVVVLFNFYQKITENFNYIIGMNNLGFVIAIYLISLLLIYKKVNMSFLWILFLLTLVGSRASLFFVFVYFIYFLIPFKLFFIVSFKLVSSIVLVCFLYLYGLEEFRDIIGYFVENSLPEFITTSGTYSDIIRLIEIPSKIFYYINLYDCYLFGLGLDFRPEDTVYQEVIPHNGYLLIFSHLGIVGLLIYLLFVFVAMVFNKGEISIIIVNFYVLSLFYGSLLLVGGIIYAVFFLLLVQILKNIQKVSICVE